jgi:hypothetical protein
MVSFSLSLSEQGIFFTFLSIAAIQSIFEAGITSVFFFHVAHEKSNLVEAAESNLIGAGGALQRLHYLIKYARWWFTTLAIIFAVLVGISGYYFLSSSISTENLSISWQFPYFLLIAAVSLALFNLSRIPIIEGYGEIAQVAKYRLRSNVISSVVLWIGMAGGWGLWALALSYFIQNSLMAAQINFLFNQLKIDSYTKIDTGKSLTINWRSEIFPFQWRIAISYFCGYIISQSIIPFVLHTHGSEAAGQVGLMLAIFNSLAVIIASYMYAAAPKYATYIARKNREPLIKLFSKVTIFSLAAAVVIYGMVLLSSALIKNYIPFFSYRLANTEVIFWMAVIGMINVYVGSASTLVRAQKKEPMLLSSIAISLSYIISMLYLKNAVVDYLFMIFALIQIFIALPFTIIIIKKSNIMNK